MSIFKQKTLSKDISIDGVGLHSGKNASLKIKPANPNSGIIFKRVDLNKNNEIIPDVYNVSSAVLCTTISNEYGAKVSTIEHLMGALFGLGIDNALIEIDNQEVPILDGSAKLFVEKILTSYLIPNLSLGRQKGRAGELSLRTKEEAQLMKDFYERKRELSKKVPKEDTAN